MVQPSFFHPYETTFNFFLKSGLKSKQKWPCLQCIIKLSVLHCSRKKFLVRRVTRLLGEQYPSTGDLQSQDYSS